MSDPLARRRPLAQTGYRTPLLVPSYSSRGFPGLATLHQGLREATTRVSLVSAFDIHHGVLPIEAVYESDVTILDSGGYEAYASSELSKPLPWTDEEYRSILTRVEDRNFVIPVSFDFNDPQPVEAQLEQAEKLRRDFPKWPWTWLAKPESKGERCVRFESLKSVLPRAAGFSVIGVTEEELGLSVTQRVQTISGLRRCLAELGRDTPIHVFGCLDPAAMPLYILAGADIFDSLQWLRSVCHPDGLFRITSAIIQDGRLDADEEAIKMVYRRANVDLLQRYEREWAKALDTPDIDPIHAIGIDGAGAKLLKRLRDAG